jgi:molybdopterin-biosynthesis enzyme MoeA-like protein
LVAYSFLIPIITDILEIVQNGANIESASKTIAKRLIASGVVIVSQTVLSDTIKRIIKKIN